MERRDIPASQHFLSDPRLVADMVAQAGLGSDDVVYDIGAGTGAITRELARLCRRVIAVEIDPELFSVLEERFGGDPAVELHNEDFLRHRIRERDYKVFSSIPFCITADILRKLLCGGNAPQQAHMIMQKRAAWRFAGLPRERVFSLLLKPWWRLAVVRHFRRTDFTPPPSVDCALLRVLRRVPSPVSEEERSSYEEFIRCGVLRGRANAKQNLKHVFTYTQWKRLARELGFAVNAAPTELSAQQWTGLFRFYRRIASRPVAT